MSRQILVLLTLFVAEPTFAQRHLPVREGLSEAKITVTDGGGQSLVGASILLSGPTQRQALSVAHGVEFTDLPPGQYRVSILSDQVPPTDHTMTIIGGIRYEALWMVGPSRKLKGPSAPAVSTLGPLEISQVKVTRRGDVRYVTTNRSHTLMFRRTEVRRVYPDGSSRVDVQEHDSFDDRVLSSLRIGGFGLNAAGESPVDSGESVHLARETGRSEVPLSAQVRVVAIVTADGTALGAAKPIQGVVDRRQGVVEEFEYWIDRYQTRIRDFGGVTLSDVLVQELEIPRSRERTADYRHALLEGVRNVRRGGWDDEVASRVILGQLKSMIQFHDFALDQLSALQR